MISEIKVIPLLALAFVVWVRIRENPSDQIPSLTNTTVSSLQACVHCIYRLTLHPLSKYPGPRLAAITSWYATLFVARGDLHEKTHKWHTKYGNDPSEVPGLAFLETRRSLTRNYQGRW